ncbi:MAG: prephenate dehydrogenase/arogenate dehydrogenase family protein [Myxococcales bacterium]|nr:prephenate dehydrogenase/arogenate dehydrogenase family protein [Myxococcales bacterium]
MKRVGIIGYGRFGRALGALVSKRLPDADVLYFDPDAAHTDGAARRVASMGDLARSSDVVVVATPVEVMRAVFDELAGELAPLATAPLVMDVGSVKLHPAKAMAAAFPEGARVIGTHPLFGPASLAEGAPLTTVLCPADDEAVTAAAETFWQGLGCATLRVTAEEHDRAMARTHALAFFFAKGLLDAGLADKAAFAPPSFAMLARSVDSVRADAGHLFRTIEIENPFAAEARSALLAALASADASLTLGESSDVGASTGPSRPQLTRLRERIDDVDRELLRLLARRAALAEEVSVAKAALNLPTRDAARENEVFATRRAWAEAFGLNGDAVTDVMTAILRFSRGHQGSGRG